MNFDAQGTIIKSYNNINLSKVNDIELEQTNTVLFTSIFHHGRHKVKDCKEYLDSKRIPDRI